MFKTCDMVVMQSVVPSLSPNVCLLRVASASAMANAFETTQAPEDLDLVSYVLVRIPVCEYLPIRIINSRIYYGCTNYKFKFTAVDLRP
eukprot:SAG11_NODE_17662_length_512_cov_1.000000_1_plen_89_part_00